MSLFLISFDLSKPEKEYPALTCHLQQIGAHQVLFCDWMVRTAESREHVFMDVKQFLQPSDGVLVCTIDDALGTSLKYDISKV